MQIFLPPLTSAANHLPFWKGNLFGEACGGKRVLISTLEGYAHRRTSDDFAADWPKEMNIVGRIKLLNMNVLRLVQVALLFKSNGGHAYFRDILGRPSNDAVWLYELGGGRKAAASLQHQQLPGQDSK